jgi:hypothetical protein
MGRHKKNRKPQRRDERRVVVRGIRRDPPDMRKLGKALLGLAQAEAERQAQEQHTSHRSAERPESPDVQQPGARGGDTDGTPRP